MYRDTPKEYRCIIFHERKYFKVYFNLFIALNIIKLTYVIQLYNTIFKIANGVSNINFRIQDQQKISDVL